jgi:hypothetical protein
MIDEAALSRQYALLRPSLDERGRRLFAATQAQALGHGGIAAVARATGMAASTIGRGLKEIATSVPPSRGGRLRQPGGGRKRLTDRDPLLERALLDLVSPSVPMNVRHRPP